MYPTREIRWFLPDPIPDAAAWFRHMGIPLEQASPRTDRYLLLSQCPDLGLKLREGQLEPKKRRAHPQEGKLGVCARGYFETWIKWSFALGMDSDLPEADDPHWVSVQKRRTGVQLTHSDRGPEIHSLDVPLKAGCQVEYAQIELGNRKWYSYCLEWFGEGRVSMDKVSDEIFGNSTLTREWSMGYPEFLIKYGKK